METTSAPFHGIKGGGKKAEFTNHMAERAAAVQELAVLEKKLNDDAAAVAELRR